jgi:hypothetical protein
MINGDKTQAENNRSSITESLCLPACNVRARDPSAPAVPIPSASERTRSSLFMMFNSFVMVENDFECHHDNPLNFRLPEFHQAILYLS